MLGLSNARAKQYKGYAMLWLSNSIASLIHGLIALKGLKTTLRLVLYNIQGLIAIKGLKAKGLKAS